MFLKTKRLLKWKKASKNIKKRSIFDQFPKKTLKNLVFSWFYFNEILKLQKKLFFAYSLTQQIENPIVAQILLASSQNVQKMLKIFYALKHEIKIVF